MLNDKLRAMTKSSEQVAIIGARGFIGGHLASRYQSKERYDRQNIQDLDHSRADLFIIASAPAAKWIANSNPEADSENIDSLIASLQPLADKNCVLISTIDVFPTGTTFYEDTPIPTDISEAYGRNRSRLESAVRELSASTLILRLPGMYGPGLKKNLIYDLASGKSVTGVNPESTFQFYDVRNLFGHIEICLRLGMEFAHLATEPVSVAQIYEFCFSQNAPDCETQRISYSMQTRYAHPLAGREGQYLSNSQEILDGIRNWISRGVLT